MNRPTVCIADDHALFREGMVALLRADGRLTVADQASDGEETVRIVSAIRPDVLFLDVDMPGPPVSTTVHTIRRVSPSTRVVVVTMHDDEVLRTSLVAAGATEVFPKSLPVRELIDATLLALARRPTPASRTAAGCGLLTQREREVMRLVALARTNKQIALELGVTVGTVKRHLNNTFGKLGAASRIDALRKARLLGENLAE